VEQLDRIEVSVQDLVDALRSRDIAFDWRNPGIDLANRRIGVERVQKPGLALTGFSRHINSARVQVVGETEIEYLKSLTEDERLAAVESYVSLNPVALFCLERA
jgi:HPr kinase/phosphorylase